MAIAALFLLTTVAYARGLTSLEVALAAISVLFLLATVAYILTR
jgi:hypothetical protein